MHQGRFVFTFVCAGLLALSGVAQVSQSVRPAPPGDSAAPATMSGKVTDAQGGPVEGAKVTLYQMVYAEGASSPDPKVVEEKTTGADGTFTFAAVPLIVQIYVVACKEGLALGWVPGRVAGNKPLEISLGQAKDLAGEVVDEKGQPVAEATVRITAVQRGKPGYLAAPGFFCSKTDSNGRFLFAAMPAEATFEFTVEKPGRATIGTLDRSTYRGGKYQFAPGQEGIKLVLPPEARIEGTVVEKAGGKPASGVMVTATPDSRMSMLLTAKTATTAQDGTFRIGALTAGAYIVQLPRSSDRIGTFSGGTFTAPSLEKLPEWVAEPVRVTVKAGQTNRDVKLELTAGGIIEVLVKDSAGKPVPGATVSVFRVQEMQSLGGQSLNGRTDEQGVARIRVVAGQYVPAGVYKEGFARRTGVIRTSDAFEVPEGETKRIEQVLNAGPKVAGIVRDEAGSPLAGVTFEVLPMMASPNEVTSDASGKFEVAWDPGMGPMNTTAILVARDVDRNLAQTVDLDEAVRNLDVKLQPGVVITGTVLNDQGQPLPRAQVRVMVQTSRMIVPLGRRDLATTGPDGRFEIKAIPLDRQCTVTALAEGYGKSEVRLDPGDIKDNRFDAGQLKLIPANLSLSGVIVDSNDQPVAGANVYAYGEGQPDSRMIETDTEGKFTIKGVCPGLIRLQANSRGSRPMYGMTQAEGGATDLRIVISSRPTGMPYTARRATLLKGKPLPPLKDLGVDLPADAEGKMLLVCFWDMGQRPSRNCITQLAAQAGPLGEKGVRIVAVHAGQIEDSALRQWIEKNKIPFPSGTVSGDIDKTKSAWGVGSLPHLILTDKKHTVIAEGVGLDDLDKQIEAAGR